MQGCCIVNNTQSSFEEVSRYIHIQSWESFSKWLSFQAHLLAIRKQPNGAVLLDETAKEALVSCHVQQSSTIKVPPCSHVTDTVQTQQRPKFCILSRAYDNVALWRIIK